MTCNYFMSKILLYTTSITNYVVCNTEQYQNIFEYNGKFL